MLAHYSNDEHMIEAYKQNRDLYAVIASKIYHNNYEDNLEFNPETGKIQPDGKKRRSSTKSVLLGIMYGLGAKALSEQIGVSMEEAEDIRKSFFREFPKVEKWTTETRRFAHTTGYVEDAWGRRRRLPDIKRPKYEVENDNFEFSFNPLLYSSGINKNTNNELVDDYLLRLSKSRSKKESDSIKEQAKRDNIRIKDNAGFVAQAERQCVNARIQGGAASMSKRAMIDVYNDKRLKNLGFKLLIAVHDELIGECPEENKEECKQLLSEIMINSAKPEVNVPMKCDVDDFKSWYFDVYSSEIIKEYKNLLEKSDETQAFSLLCSDHVESTNEILGSIIKNI